MKKYLILIIFALTAIQLYSQDLILQIHGNKAIDAIQFEERQGGMRIQNKLADIVKNQVSAQQLQTLHDNIDINDSLIVYDAGMQMSLDGTTSAILQYRYKKDPASPPNQTITVLFDDKDKILSIRPRKRL